MKEVIFSKMTIDLFLGCLTLLQVLWNWRKLFILWHIRLVDPCEINNNLVEYLICLFLFFWDLICDFDLLK